MLRCACASTDEWEVNMESESMALVRRLCQAWSRRSVDEILDFFTEDGVYHNMPMEPLKGKAAIRPILEMIIGPCQRIEFEVLRAVADGDLVLTERVDRFEMGDKRVALPVAGVFEVSGGKIVAWRDYFDMAAWTKQTS